MSLLRLLYGPASNSTAERQTNKCRVNLKILVFYDARGFMALSGSPCGQILGVMEDPLLFYSDLLACEHIFAVVRFTDAKGNCRSVVPRKNEREAVAILSSLSTLLSIDDVFEHLFNMLDKKD